MNDKKKLAIFLVALVVLIAISAVVYNSYKDRVDPETGTVSGEAPALAQESAVSASASTSTGLHPRNLAASAAPDITMEDANGNEVKLSDFRGKPVILNFWTSWCDYCKSEMPIFESAYQQYGSQIQFVMLNAVQSERSSEDGRDFIQSSNYTFPVFYDTQGNAMTAYGLRGFPATVFIDAEGNIVSRNIGAINEEKLNENIQTLLGQ